MTTEPKTDALAETQRILLQAGHIPDGIEEKVRAWHELKPLIASTEPEGHRKKWDLAFAAASPVGVVRINELLGKLGIYPGRPIMKGSRILVPVANPRYQWLNKLLSIENPDRKLPSIRYPSESKRTRRTRSRAHGEGLVPTWPMEPDVALQAVKSDNTFKQSAWQGRDVWAGRCLQCLDLLLVGIDGSTITAAEIVRTEPDLPGLLCNRCVSLFRRLEARADPKLAETLSALQLRRRARAEPPADA